MVGSPSQTSIIGPGEFWTFLYLPIGRHPTENAGEGGGESLTLTGAMYGFHQATMELGGQNRHSLLLDYPRPVEMEVITYLRKYETTIDVQTRSELLSSMLSEYYQELLRTTQSRKVDSETVNAMGVILLKS